MTDPPCQGTILIVDDNLTNLQVLFTTLSDDGHRVIPAQGAASTFTRLKHVTPDLILLDIMMPEVNGFELYARLREHPRTAHAPVIFISALDDNDAILRGLRLGAVDYITKPFRAEEVQARVQRQLELDRLRRDLQTELKTRRALEESLRAAKTQADAANQAKSAFLANMSHELRTPLNAILGYSQILAAEPSLSPDLKHAVETVRRSGDYLLLLIDDILDLAKIEAGRLELYPAPFAIERFLREMANVFAVRARDKGVQLHYTAGADLPATLVGDEKRLRQICMNLLGNAIKFTERGEVRLEADYRAGSLHITVTDTGIGIKAEKLGALFRPFEQSGAAKYKQQGTGLGLAIAKQLVEAMNGRIDAASTPGRGSRFSIVAPLAVTDVRGLPLAEPAGGPITGYRRSDGAQAPLRLLIADDDADNRAVLLSLLSGLGFELSHAQDGHEAESMAMKQRPDLVLMDLIMPRLSGLDATRSIRAQTSIPVIAVSARSFREDRAASAAAGCCEHLSKPLDHADLLDALQRRLPLQWLRSDQAPALPAVPDAAALRLVAPELLTQLEDAVLDGDGAAMQAAVRAIAGRQPELARALERWLTEYQYQRLLDLLAETPRTADPAPSSDASGEEMPAGVENHRT